MTQLARVLMGILLARLLSPDEYGLAGMALLFTSFVLIFSDLSLGAALVQRPKVTQKDLSTVFWTSVVVGFALSVAGVAVAGPVARFFHEPAVKPLFAVVSLSFIFIGLQTTQAAVFQRQMMFRLIALRVSASTIVGGVVGVVCAAIGLGAWALIAQSLTTTAVATVLLWASSPWRPRFTFSFASLQDLGGFGFNVLGSHLVGYFHRNADNLLVGRYLGTAALGAYSVAYNIMLLPFRRLIIPLEDALFPAFSRIQTDHERVSRMWLRVETVIAAIVMPLMIGLAVISPEFVVSILGEKWRAAIPVLRILSIVALFQSLAMMGERVLQAIDKAQVVFRFNIANLVLTIGAFVVGLRWGITGVAACYAAVTIPLQVIFAWMTGRALGTRLWTLGLAVAGPTLATAVMALAVAGSMQLVAPLSLSATVRLLVGLGVGAVTYLPLCILFTPSMRDELSRLRAALARRREKGRAAALEATGA